MTALGASAPGSDAQRFSHPRGSLEIIAGSGSMTGIAVANQMPGAVAVEKKHKITDAALKAIDADMQTYIERKQQEPRAQSKANLTHKWQKYLTR